MPRPRPPRRTAARGSSRGAPVESGRRFAAETFADAVGALESGVPTPVVCRRFAVSDRTLYRWRRDAARRLKRPA